MSKQNREIKKYAALLLVTIAFFSCQKEKKVEEVQMPDLQGYEEIVYGPVHTVKLLMYNVTNNGDSLIKKDRFSGKTDLNLPTGREALVTFNKEGLCIKILGYRYGTSTIGGGGTFEYDDEGRLTGKKFYRGYPFDVNNCHRVIEFEYKRSEGYDVVVETQYIPVYIDRFTPAKGKVLSELERQLDYRTVTFYNKYGNQIKNHYTQYDIDDDDPEYKRTVVRYSDTIVQPQYTYEKGVPVSADNGRIIFKYDENGKEYAVVNNYKKRTTYSYPNGQPKGFDCSWSGTYENPLGCSHLFNEEGHFLESARQIAKYSQKDKHGNWTRMLIGHKRPGTILIGEREITYYKDEK